MPMVEDCSIPKNDSPLVRRGLKKKSTEKIKIFEAAHGSIGWDSLAKDVNKFMEGKDVKNVLQTAIGDRLIITVYYYG